MSATQKTITADGRIVGVTENGQGAAAGAEPQAPAPGIYERIALITGEAQVKATGKTEQGGVAMSIADVERVIGDLCAKHGVVTRWTDVSLESYEQPTRNGSMRMWLRHMRVKVVNADLPDEAFEDDWTDIGTNPMAAASFVRKGYYRALFHLADEADEAKGVTPDEGGGQQVASGPATPRTAPQDGRTKPLGPCPDCAEEGITAASGKPAMYWPPRKAGHRPQCNGIQDGVYLNHQMRPEAPLSGVGDAVRDAADQIPLEAYADGY